ncbi:hypothetical protein [Haloplanus salinarum]|uniref:hypothetical protein n=1 Tax=Haloplanus salinarum TaxID=1912324 RepID=UPI00214CDE98|nr:hypothetical protein [Haloplanus salinarum]
MSEDGGVSNDESGGPAILKTIGKIVSWALGLFLLLLSLGGFQDSIPFGFSLLLLGLFLLPPVRNRFGNLIDSKFSRWIVSGILILGFVTMLVTVPPTEVSENNDASEGIETSSPGTSARCWIVNHRSEISEASEQLNQGTNALEEGDGSRALMHLEKSFNQYETLNESAHEAPIRNDTREQLLEGYFHAAFQGTAATYSGVYELQVNDDADAANRMAERQERHFETAAQRREELKESLGVSPSTDLTEISGNC